MRNALRVRYAQGFAPLRIRKIMQKLAGSVPRPTSLSGVLWCRYAVCLCRVAAVPQLKLRHTRAPAARRPRKTHKLVCDCSSMSPLTLKPLRSPTPCPFTAIATALLSGCAAHAEARSMVTATVAAGLGFSVASLPQCRRGAFPASISAVRRLPQCRYAVGCAASGKKKRRGFASVSAACFLSSCAGGGKVVGVGKSPQRQKHPHQFIYGRAVQLPPNWNTFQMVDSWRGKAAHILIYS